MIPERGKTYQTKFGSYLCLKPGFREVPHDALMVDINTGKCFIALNAEVYPKSGKIYFGKVLATHFFGELPQDEKYAEGLFPAGPKPWEHDADVCPDI